MSGRHSNVRADHIEYALHLVFDDAGGVRLTRGQPHLGRQERSMTLLVKLPKAIFKTPTLSASIDVAAGQTTIPPIDLSAATDALRSALGVDVDVRVVSAND